jgi:hypothetical protein
MSIFSKDCDCPPGDGYPAPRPLTEEEKRRILEGMRKCGMRAAEKMDAAITESMREAEMSEDGKVLEAARKAKTFEEFKRLLGVRLDDYDLTGQVEIGHPHTVRNAFDSIVRSIELALKEHGATNATARKIYIWTDEYPFPGIDALPVDRVYIWRVRVCREGGD